MSCTVIAVPLALHWVIGAVAAATAASAAAGAIANSQLKNKENQWENIILETNNTDCEDVHTITAEHFMEKNFETPFVDKEILLKTLTEHGVQNIEDKNNTVSGTVDNYTLTFSRNSETEPYIVRIGSKQGESLEEKVDDLNQEYSMNVQEDTYLHILEKLKENNMHIEEEVVEDDNTIVLTVNIE